MYTIGIDLGGTNIKAGVVDSGCHIVGTAKCKTALPRSAEAIVDDMARMAREAAADAGIRMEEVAYVGIGSPGTCNEETGIVEYANNLRFENVPLRQMMHDRLGLDIYIENDANAAALGEALAGAAKGTQSCVCITLGTGVGGGIIIGGKIYGGFNFAGAELGHIVINVDGELCTCGRHGCWEAYASATALIRQTRQAMVANPDSAMWRIAGTLDKVDGRTAFDAMRAGDVVGKKVVDRYIQYIACGLINVINIFQPEVLCVGGGISREGEAVMAPVRAYVGKYGYARGSAKQPRIVAASLAGDAGIIGAALLGTEKK